MDSFGMTLDPFATAVEITAPPPNSDTSFPWPSMSPSSPDISMLDGENIGKGEGDVEDEEFGYAYIPGFASYDLRPSARDGKTVFVTTWHDMDQSGDYDPRFKRKQASKKEGKRQALVRRDSPTGDGEAEERQSNGFRLSKLAARQQGCSMVVTLKIDPKAWRALASTIPDNWPGEINNILSDEYIQQEAVELTCSTDQLSSRRMLRRRGKYASDPCEAPTGVGILDPAHIEPDLTGHPAARGCVACRILGMPCPLIQEDSTWPCHFCVEDDCPCELITPPTTKVTCESCRNKKLPCSYVHNAGNAAQPCAHCNDFGSSCLAGPGLGGIRERISYDRDYSKPRPIDPQGREYVTCAPCRFQNKKCSLRRKTDIPPCDGCLVSNTACTFEKITRKPRQCLPPLSAATSDALSSQITSRSDEMPIDERVITTALCHPVELMSEDQEHCHWCRDGSDGLNGSVFGLVGLGWKKVTVKPSAQHNNLAYEETHGGHAENGAQNSVMCLTCSMKRIHILRCLEHELRPLAELFQPNESTIDPAKIDFQGYYTRLETQTLLPTDKFCTLCPSLALFKCCSLQDTNLWGESISCELPESEGCGLHLCEDCKITHDAHAGGEALALDEVIRSILREREGGKGEEGVWYLGPRADLEFLLGDGMLIRKALMDGDDGEGGGDGWDC